MGLFVVMAGVAISGSAHAQTNTTARWRNADTTYGTYYLGVSGGVVCNESCGIPDGKSLITYQKSQTDQIWTVTTIPLPGFINLYNVITDSVPRYPGFQIPECIAFPWSQQQGLLDGLNANAVTAECSSPGATGFEVQSAESLGAPFQYWGCYALSAANSLYLSVYQGKVKNGSPVVMWPLCIPNSGNCGNPSNAWHPDQFWCPEVP